MGAHGWRGDRLRRRRSAHGELPNLRKPAHHQLPRVQDVDGSLAEHAPHYYSACRGRQWSAAEVIVIATGSGTDLTPPSPLLMRKPRQVLRNVWSVEPCTPSCHDGTCGHLFACLSTIHHDASRPNSKYVRFQYSAALFCRRSVDAASNSVCCWSIETEASSLLSRPLRLARALRR